MAPALPLQIFGKDNQPHTMGGLDAEHLETKTEIIHDLAVHRQHEQEALAEQLAGEDKKIKRIIRKLDLRLVLTLAILYVWAFIDRGNLANVSTTKLVD
jgi:hypothetical protein